MSATGALTKDEPDAAECPPSPPITHANGPGHRRPTALHAARDPAATAAATSGILPRAADAAGAPVADTDAAPLPLLDPRRQRDLIKRAAGRSTRQVAGLIADAAGPGATPPRDTLRSVGSGRYTLKVSIDEECERGLRQLKGLLSHLDPRMSWGDLVARLVQEAVERHDPRRGGRGRRRPVSPADETRKKKCEAERTVARTAAHRGTNDCTTSAPECNERVAVRRQDHGTSAPVSASGRFDFAPAAASATSAPKSASSTSPERPAPAAAGRACALTPRSEHGASPDDLADGVAAQIVATDTPLLEKGSGNRQHRDSSLAPRAGTPAAHPEPVASIDDHVTYVGTATAGAGHAAAIRRRSAGRRAIPAAVRRLVWKRDEGSCCYRDPLTGRCCNSSYLLQIDHVLPVAQGGALNRGNCVLRASHITVCATGMERSHSAPHLTRASLQAKRLGGSP